MGKLIYTPLLMLICCVCYASSFEQLKSEGLSALRTGDYQNAARCFNQAVQDNLNTERMASSVAEVRLYLACAYIEQGKYKAALQICHEILNKSKNAEHLKIARNLKSKAFARTLYANGIRDVREVYEKTHDGEIAYHFIDYIAGQQSREFNTANAIDQMVYFVNKCGYSPHASWLGLRLSKRFGTNPQHFYDLLQARVPRLNSNADFMFDYARNAGTKDYSIVLRCLHVVIKYANDPRKRAEALFQRHLVYENLREYGLARRDILSCKQVVDDHDIADMKRIVNERISNFNLLVRKVGRNAESEPLHDEGNKQKPYSIISYVCVFIVMCVVCYRVWAIFRTTRSAV